MRLYNVGLFELGLFADQRVPFAVRIPLYPLHLI